MTTNRTLIALAAAAAAGVLAFARRHGVDVDDDGVIDRDGDAELENARRTVVTRAMQSAAEWAGLSETDPAAAERLADYWAATNRGPQPPSTPWSAAWISWVAREWLEPSAAHVDYVRSALDPGPGVRYRALPANAVGELRPGDIVVRGRQGSEPDWDSIFRQRHFVPSHGDVYVGGNAYVGGGMVVGGNVQDGVRQRPLSAVPGKPYAILRLARELDTVV